MIIETRRDAPCDATACCMCGGAFADGEVLVGFPDSWAHVVCANRDDPTAARAA